MRLVALATSVALVAAVTTSAWAAPADPVPVKDDPHVVEGTPTSHGDWLGWTQDSRRDARHRNLFVQRGTQVPVRVNAPGTQGLSGGIAGHRMYYVQQYRDRRPRLIRFDLDSQDRTPLPPKVNHHRHSVHVSWCDHQHGKSRVVSGVRGNATVSGRWVLYSGYMEVPGCDVYPYDTVMLYNRVEHQLRTITSDAGDEGVTYAGQVNGRYVSYWWSGRYGGEKFYRYDIRTGRTVELPLPDDSSWDPGVSSDGTVYYVHAVHSPDGAPVTYDLVRQPIDGPAQVVTTLTDQPAELFVRDRPNGSRAVFFSWHGDVYKLVDRPSA